MRTINADALTTWIKESQRMTSKVKAILCYIETMPSQNRPTGKWVGAREFCQHLEEVTGEKYQTTGIESMIYCNQCWQASSRRSKYCPNCGSCNGGESDDKERSNKHTCKL